MTELGRVVAAQYYRTEQARSGQTKGQIWRRDLAQTLGLSHTVATIDLRGYPGRHARQAAGPGPAIQQPGARTAETTAAGGKGVSLLGPAANQGAELQRIFNGEATEELRMMERAVLDAQDDVERLSRGMDEVDEILGRNLNSAVRDMESAQDRLAELRRYVRAVERKF